IFIFLVKIGHFCRFPSDQGTARLFASSCDPGNKLFDQIEVYSSQGKIVQEKKRPRTLNHDIVDTHGHQVYSYRIVPVRHECDFKLCPHSIGGRNQYGVCHILEIQRKQPSKTAYIRDDAAMVRGTNYRPDSSDKFICLVEVNSS